MAAAATLKRLLLCVSLQLQRLQQVPAPLVSQCSNAWLLLLGQNIVQLQSKTVWAVAFGGLGLWLPLLCSGCSWPWRHACCRMPVGGLAAVL
jgi:hypothetical protein